MLWLNRIEQEYDNLRATLRWSLATANGIDLESALVAALWRFWDLHGDQDEARYWLHDVLAKTAGMRTLERARVLLGAGSRAWADAGYAQATMFLEESFSICREQQDHSGSAMALMLLGSVAHDQANYQLAETCYSESLSLYQAIGDKRGMAEGLAMLGLIATFRGDVYRSRQLRESSVALFREVGDKSGIAEGLNWLASSLESQGDYDRAETCLRESLSLLEELNEKPLRAFVLLNLGRLVLFSRNDPERAAMLTSEGHRLFQHVGDVRGLGVAIEQLGWIAWIQGNHELANEYAVQCLSEFRKLGDQRLTAKVLRLSIWIAHRRGDNHQALKLLREQLALWQSLGMPTSVPTSLEDFGMLLAFEQPERAIRLVAVAHALRDKLDTRIAPFFRAKLDRTIAAARDRLGEGGFAAAWAEGQNMTPEQAIVEALAPI